MTSTSTRTAANDKIAGLPGFSAPADLGRQQMAVARAVPADLAAGRRQAHRTQFKDSLNRAPQRWNT